MAKKDDNKSASEAQAQLDRIRDGQQVEAGWCVDFDRDPAAYRCSDEDQAVARGDVSRSIYGDVLTYADGRVETREKTTPYAGAGPVRGDQPPAMVPGTNDQQTIAATAGGGGGGGGAATRGNTSGGSGS